MPFLDEFDKMKIPTDLPKRKCNTMVIIFDVMSSLCSGEGCELIDDWDRHF
jgi:hypothetical protein